MKGHDQIYKMFGLLHGQKFAIVGYEGDPADTEDADIRTTYRYREIQRANN